MDPTLIAGVLAVVAIGGVGLAFAGQGQGPTTSKKRVSAVAGGKTDRRKNVVDAATLKRKQNTQDALKTLTMSEKEARKRRLSIKGKLAQAGIQISLPVYWMIAVGVGLVLALIGLIVQKGLFGAAGGFFIGTFGLPLWFIGMKVSGRQKKFQSQLADAIDVIVRGVKSGLPLNQCMRIIAADSPEPLRSEFQSLTDAMAMGVPLDQALAKLYERTPLAEVNFFSIVLVIQQKTGGNLSESLGNLSTVLRARKMMKEKVKALTSEAQASAMIIGALPFIVMLLVYLTKPDYIMILFTDPRGNLILLGAATMMTVGVTIMQKMVNFKF
ncbi:flp pilus assembly protein TadB [alpha proteobacterium U9-1i]|nr:flp pilus assembly protein TadB [alpha proteobacterium U9-1i]